MCGQASVSLPRPPSSFLLTHSPSGYNLELCWSYADQGPRAFSGSPVGGQGLKDVSYLPLLSQAIIRVLDQKSTAENRTSCVDAGASRMMISLLSHHIILTPFVFHCLYFLGGFHF